jgi:hypothetical protein
MEQKQSNGLSKEQKMFSLIAEHEASSMTVKDFCELYDLSPGTYHYWQKKYHARLGDQPMGNQSSFTLLKVTDERSTSQEVEFLQKLKIREYPTTILIDPEGKIVLRGKETEEIDQFLGKALQ